MSEGIKRTARSVDEWSSENPDAKIPTRVRLRVFERWGGVCGLSGRKIRAGDKWELDHRIPLILGGKHAESNLWPTLSDAHKAKTARDVQAKSKADRIRAKHLGLWPKSKRPLKSRGFAKAGQ